MTKASSFGFDGVELRGLRGELHLPLVHELARDPAEVRKRCAESKVELVCLATSAYFASRDARVRAGHKAAVIEFIELAAKLGCPYVKVFAGQIEPGEYAPVVLPRIVASLKSLAEVASRHRVTILVENGGDFPSSRDCWHLVDAVEHPSVKLCWNQSHAKTVSERPTLSLPRLGNKIGLVHLCDATFDEQGVLLEYKPLGSGNLEVARQIELLRGLAWDGYLMFEWPKLWIDSLPDAEAVLPDAIKFLRECLQPSQVTLSAYKGDKNAPRWAPRGATRSTTGAAQ